MLSQAAPFGFNPGFVPLPDNARQAVYDSLIQRGFARKAILDSYNFTSRNVDLKLNMLAFADPVRRTPAEYAGCVVYNATNDLTEREIVSVLAPTAAPFHIIHREDRFSFWASTLDGKTIQPVELGTAISYSQLSQILQEYRVDFAPEQIVSVKQGRSQFVHPHLRKLEPLQLALWAIDITRDTLVDKFGQAVTQLRNDMGDRPDISDREITGLAIQMLGATILADTGIFDESMRQQGLNLSLDRLFFTAAERYPTYFRSRHFFLRNYEKIERAYTILRQIYYSAFVPDMLSALYTKAYSKEQRKKLGFYDTPLYLTRRILQNIPIEFLPPDHRVIVDMGCGWGSFLIAGTERLSQLSDMRGRSLREHIIGNDIDTFTAQLAGLGLLLATSEDSWHIEHEDARQWPWIETHNPGIIVGNPPFRGRRDLPETLDDLMPTEGKRTRVEAANAHIDLAIRRVRPGGYIAMIMPQSFLISEAAPKIRHNLLENCDITEIWELPRRVFPDAKVHPMVLFARKESEKRKTIFPIRTRNIQNGTIEEFVKSGIFTASSINSDIYPSKSNKVTINTTKNDIISKSVILSNLDWNMIRQKCNDITLLATIFPGTIRGIKTEKKRWLNYSSQSNILWLTDARRIMSRSWYINYDAAISATYPRDFEEPRLENKHLLDSEKIIMIASPNTSWGRRAKAVVERRGYHVSHSFWVVSPNTETNPHLSKEALTAIINWHVSNAWIAEHRSYPWIERRIIDTIPIPCDLSPDDCRSLTDAVQKIELAANANQQLPEEAVQSIDTILRRAYDLDDATYARLRAISAWDERPQITLDPQPDRSIADYVVSGIVEDVQPEQGVVSLWISDFDDIQTVPIDPLMPGWMLRPETPFRAKIPFANKRKRSLDGVVWNSFAPQQHTYQDEKELVQELSYIFGSGGEQDG
ncbi:HsdM family class I SAM-dependent methyltransferase [Candidatus Oscillochloris fontis]|uniref:HsdM family class I SAM-dependent methyltransferase n=1 Tax=Candidatus Oscillochloris fontis TaxID=2496868 RepID=UPI00101E0696|nr:N-6 DNA methylase [Candidatus Oscillochloris fontis]